MTQDEIISIARTAGFPTDYNDKRLLHHDLVIRLFGLAATFGAAKEREACANLKKEIPLDGVHSTEYEEGFWDALAIYSNWIKNQ